MMGSVCVLASRERMPRSFDNIPRIIAGFDPARDRLVASRLAPT
jgi:hypothetical protein